MVERRDLAVPMLVLDGLLTIGGARQLEPLTLKFREEFSLTETMNRKTFTACHFRLADSLCSKSAGNQLAVSLRLAAGDTDRLELKLDTEEEEDEVFLLSVTLLL